MKVVSMPVQSAKKLEVFDKPMCCSTGVCGPQVDSQLALFAADLEWLKTQSVQVSRFNLAHEPQAFIQNAVVQEALSKQGVDCLPLLLISGALVSAQQYPNRDQLAEWFALDVEAKQPLPMLRSTPCCGDSGCC